VVRGADDDDVTSPSNNNTAAAIDHIGRDLASIVDDVSDDVMRANNNEQSVSAGDGVVAAAAATVTDSSEDDDDDDGGGGGGHVMLCHQDADDFINNSSSSSSSFPTHATGFGELIVSYCSCTTPLITLISIIIRLEAYSQASAEYWIHFAARFDGVHAFGYNSAESEASWMKSRALGVHCWELALADFVRDPRSSDSFGGRRNFVLFFVR